MIPIRLGYLFDFSFTFERTTITVEYRLLQRNNDAQLVFIRFQNAVPGIWKIDIKPCDADNRRFSHMASDGRILEERYIFWNQIPTPTFTEPSGGNTMTVAFITAGENGVDINSGRGILEMKK